MGKRKEVHKAMKPRFSPGDCVVQDPAAGRRWAHLRSVSWSAFIAGADYKGNETLKSDVGLVVCSKPDIEEVMILTKTGIWWVWTTSIVKVEQ